ncbi:MAG: nolA5 [Microbacterium sp.]|jgi:DNA-binding transcriptional MerR regulator|nr:nolA5 [Microbacterium sp.]
MNITEDTLYSIGEVAHRTGLSVSAIRYYADEGIVHPTDATDSGHRLYDLDAIARLEFVRTLRDLETGLDQVRRALAGATTLRDLLAEHLDTIEKRTADLQAKRAVLRALVRQDGTAERANLLRKLVTMSDAERKRLVDEFIDEVSAGLPVELVNRVLGVRPQLPSDPTPEQLDAWVTLAELLRDTTFRAATGTYLRETYAEFPGSTISAPHVQEFIATMGNEVTPQLLAAHRAGFAADDAHVIALAARLVEQTADAFGVAADDDLRQRLAARYRELDTIIIGALQDADYNATEGRYLELVSIINGQTHPDADLLNAAGRGRSEGDELAFGDFGQWLSAAILATP